MYTYEEIVGNELIIKNLKKAVDFQKVSHAYIISGQQGMGKKLLANVFAKTLQCEGGGSSPCCHCTSCRVFDTGNHTDVIWVRSKKTKGLGVDDIREQVIQNVMIKPYQYKYKIFIIEQADKMTVQAQNALLKTLEEPPAYGIFLLLAENSSSFLPTILSRCAVLKLRPLPTPLVEEYLYRHHIGDSDKIAVYTEYAQGSIGKALQIAQSEEFSKQREDTLVWLTAVAHSDLVSVMAIAKEMEVYKENLQFLDIASLWYRDVLTAKLLKDKSYLIQKDKIDSIIEQAQQESCEEILQKIEAVWQAKRQLSQNANFQLVMEVMLIKLKERLNR